MPRTSARANKGKHSQWNLEDVLLQEQEDVHDDDDVNSSLQPKTKKRKVDSDLDDAYDAADVVNDSSDNEEGSGNDDGEVRCTPCGATSANYDEETDQGGMMIECELCHTWQHARCMGYRSERAIPKVYKCNLCQPEKKVVKKKQPKKKDSVPGYSFSLRDKTRMSVAKAFLGVFYKNIPEKSLPEGVNSVMMATKWAQELEAEVYKLFPQKDKHYTDKSRGLMVLIKKENVLRRIVSGELSFHDIVNSTPEEIDEDLKIYAEKVRQESIRRSVLTVDEDQQRIRRTHKGEEIVEDSTQQLEEADVNMVARNIDHRRIKEDSPVREIIANPEQQNYYHNEDDDDDQREEEAEEDTKAEEEDESDDSKSDLDDELEKILQDKKEEEKEEVEIRQPPKPTAPASPPKKPQFAKESPNVWKGEIVFPDFASFAGQGVFRTCTGFVEPYDAQSARLYSRFIKVAKELLPRQKHEVEGRLDKKRADDYLAKVVASRDFYLVEIRPTGNHPDYDKLYGYLLDREKVGVLSGRPTFAKDAYLIALEKSRPLPSYLRTLKGLEQQTGLFALYVVRKGYVPAAPSILKKQPAPAPAAVPAVPAQRTMLPQPPVQAAKPNTPLLDSILSTLGGTQAATNQPPANYNGGFHQQQPTNSYNKVSSLPGKPNLPRKPNFPPSHPPQQQPADLNLSGDQMKYLQELVKNNPQQARSDPQALVGMATNAGSSGGGGDDDDEFPTYN